LDKKKMKEGTGALLPCLTNKTSTKTNTFVDAELQTLRALLDREEEELDNANLSWESAMNAPKNENNAKLIIEWQEEVDRRQKSKDVAELRHKECEAKRGGHLDLAAKYRIALGELLGDEAQSVPSKPGATGVDDLKREDQGSKQRTSNKPKDHQTST